MGCEESAESLTLAKRLQHQEIRHKKAGNSAMVSVQNELEFYYVGIRAMVTAPRMHEDGAKLILSMCQISLCNIELNLPNGEGKILPVWLA